jgi:hypothetical protein
MGVPEGGSCEEKMSILEEEELFGSSSFCITHLSTYNLFHGQSCEEKVLLKSVRRWGPLGEGGAYWKEENGLFFLFLSIHPPPPRRICLFARTVFVYAGMRS